MSDLTLRDLQVLDFIMRYQENYGCRPTYQEIADELRMVTSQAGKHVLKLEKAGEIKLLYVKPR